MCDKIINESPVPCVFCGIRYVKDRKSVYVLCNVYFKLEMKMKMKINVKHTDETNEVPVGSYH